MVTVPPVCPDVPVLIANTELEFTPCPNEISLYVIVVDPLVVVVLAEWKIPYSVLV